jgi:hypothetical protein
MMLLVKQVNLLFKLDFLAHHALCIVLLKTGYTSFIIDLRWAGRVVVSLAVSKV